MQPQRASDAVRQPFTECLLYARHCLGTGGRGAWGRWAGGGTGALSQRPGLTGSPAHLPAHRSTRASLFAGQTNELMYERAPKQGNAHRGKERKKKLENRVRRGESHRKEVGQDGERAERGEGGREGRRTAHRTGTSGPLSFISVPKSQCPRDEGGRGTKEERIKRGGGWLTRGGLCSCRAGRQRRLPCRGSASSPVPTPPPAWAGHSSCATSCPVCLGGRPKVRCSGEALKAGATQFIPCPASPSPAPHGTPTYSVGEGKYWKSGDLQFLQKRNSLARSPPGLVLSDDRHYFHC